MTDIQNEQLEIGKNTNSNLRKIWFENLNDFFIEQNDSIGRHQLRFRHFRSVF